jgi:hypothetical protein
MSCHRSVDTTRGRDASIHSSALTRTDSHCEETGSEASKNDIDRWDRNEEHRVEAPWTPWTSCDQPHRGRRRQRSQTDKNVLPTVRGLLCSATDAAKEQDPVAPNQNHHLVTAEELCNPLPSTRSSSWLCRAMNTERTEGNKRNKRKQSTTQDSFPTRMRNDNHCHRK